MFKVIDNWLNKITMYRLILYYVAGLWGAGLVLSLFGLLAYTPGQIIISAVVIFTVCVLVNFIFAKVFGAPSNPESVYTTALILILIMTPTNSLDQLIVLAWASVWAMAGKYILSIYKKHIFNPAALAAAVTALLLNHSANWWVDSVYLLPLVLAGGLLVVQKIRRFDLVLSFLFSALAVIGVIAWVKETSILVTWQKILLYSPLFFFACTMLTEPATTPPTRGLRIVYGALVGALFNPFVHVWSFYFTPEVALLTGNIFSYIVSPKLKLVLTLKEKIAATPDVYDFWFQSEQKLQFKPGQYLEWTLGHEHQDNRGMRRYFTIASSPTEEGVMAGVKFYPNSSSYKKSLSSLEPGDTIVAAQLAGDFTLPADKNKKLVFMAGGIGVTPFRSMLKYLLDTNEKRDIVLIDSNYAVQDIAYQHIFDEAVARLGVKTVYTLTNKPFPSDWKGETGFVDEAMLRRVVPDFKDRIFYISGSRTMVLIFTDILKKMGVSKRNIKTDFFPGFA